MKYLWSLFAALAVLLPTVRLAQAEPAPTVAELRYGDDALRRGELRLPPGPGPFPVAVVIHGGCWLAKMDSLKGTSALADALTQRGLATWNVEYRRLGNPGGGWPGTFEDVAAAVDHLRVLAANHPLDLSRVMVVGHSAGAHLALWAASRPRLAPPWGGANVLRPAGVVAIDGPGELAPFIGMDEQICGQPVVVPLLGGTPQQRPDEYRVATPRRQLPLGMAQFFVVAELGDLMQAYIADARAAGDRVEVLSPAGAGHFDVITPSGPHGAKVVDFIATRAMAPSR